MPLNIETIVHRINRPALTRVWMEGNLKWAVGVAFCAAATFALAALAWTLGSGQLWLLAFLVFLVGSFGYLFMGMKRGLFLRPLWRLPQAGNPILLTFDDGPHPEHTPRILDILAKHRVPAVFFLTGKHVRRYPQLARRIDAEGHVIGCHTYTHANLLFAGAERVHDELTRFEQDFAQMGLERPHIFRPPNGSKTPIVEWVLRARGYQLVHWTVSPKDWKNSPPETVRDRMMEYAAPGVIFLLHDSANAAAVLPEFIPWARAQGLRFAHLAEFTTL